MAYAIHEFIFLCLTVNLARKSTAPVAMLIEYQQTGTESNLSLSGYQIYYGQLSIFYSPSPSLSMKNL